MPLPRLLLVLTEFPPAYGGMQTHAIYLCRHLHERGYPISVATYRAAGLVGFDSRLPFPVHRCLSRIGYWENIRRLEQLAGSFRPDLVYASTIFYGHLRDHLGAPVVCRSPGNDVLRPWIAWPFAFGSRALSRPWIEDRLLERFRRLDWPERVESLMIDRRRQEMRRSAAKTASVLANSDYTADLLYSLGLGREQVRVLPGGVDARRFFPRHSDRAALRRRLGLRPDNYLLMTACRLVPKKGIDLLLSAVAALRRRMPDIHLLVAGDGRHFTRYFELAGSMGLGGAVTFAGQVPHDKLHHYYWCADQFALASREHVDPKTGLRDVETMGRVLCEANASGVPALAARSGGIPSVIRDGVNGLLFEEDDRSGLVEGVERIRDDARLALRLRENGLRIAGTEFDWSILCQAHEDEFRRALPGFIASAPSHRRRGEEPHRVPAWPGRRASV